MSDSVPSRMHDAISAVIREEEQAMVTRWVVLVEVVGENGEPSFWTITSPELTKWDHVGMVEFHSRTLRPEVPR